MSLVGIKEARRISGMPNALELDSAVWSDQTISTLLKAKASDGRGEYSQMSRLALAAMSKDYEIQELKSRLERYEGYFKGTHNLSGRDLDTLRLDEQQRKAIEKAAASFVSIYSGLNQGSSVTTSAVSDIKASHVQNDPRFTIYFQMKQNAVSNDTIKRKMALDGMSALDIEAFFKYNERAQQAAISSQSTAAAGLDTIGSYVLPGSKDNNNSQSSTANATAAQSLEDAIASLAGEFDKFEKYKPMFKVLPANIIKQKMLADGISETEIDACLTRNGIALVPKDSKEDGKAPSTAPKVDPSKEPPPPGMEKKKPIAWKSRKKLKALFWIKVKNPEIPSTVWTRVNQDYTLTNGCFQALEEYFNTERLDAAVAKKAAVSAATSAGVALFDPKRTQNVLIFLSRIQLSPSKLAEYVIRLDPNELDASLTERLIPYCPSNDEINTVRAYENPSELDPVGQLFFALGSIPRVEKRLKIHDTCFKWESDASVVASQLSVYSIACDQLRAYEDSFNKLLGMVLAIGNVLNDGTPRGVAYGVKLDVITRLVGIKTCKPVQEAYYGTSEFLGTSLLHLVAWEAYNTSPEVLGLIDKFQPVIAAASLNFRQLEQDTKQLNDDIMNIRSESDISMIRIREEGGDEVAEPLKTRIRGFVQVAEPKLFEIVTLKNDVSQKLKETLAMLVHFNLLFIVISSHNVFCSFLFLFTGSASLLVCLMIQSKTSLEICIPSFDPSDKRSKTMRNYEVMKNIYRLVRQLVNLLRNLWIPMRR